MATRRERPEGWTAGTPASSASGGHIQPEVTGPLFEPSERRGAAFEPQAESQPRAAESERRAASTRRTVSEPRASSQRTAEAPPARPVRTDVIPRGTPVREPTDPRRRYRPSVRRVRRTLRHIDPVSVLKLSFIYYGCFLVVWLVVVAVLYWLLESAGLFRTIENFQEGFVFEESFEFSLLFVEKWALLIGATLAVVGALVNMLLAVLYNVASDVVGGVEMTFVERDA